MAETTLAATPATTGTGKRLVLIDGHALAYRSFFALQRMDLRTKDGRATWAVYGFLRAILDVIKSHRPDCMAVAFDRAAPTFRHEEFADYKAHRKPMPDDLRPQMDLIRAIVRAFELPIFEIDGYEADDIIGTIAKQAGREGYDVLIVTGDRDSFQLIDERINVLWTKAGTELVRMDVAAVQEKYGLTPAQIIDYKGLAGDASDNIPGVPGVGDKTATKLLQQWGTVSNLLENLDKIGGKLGEKIAANVDLARQSLRLATIDVQVPLGDIDWHACKLEMPDLPTLTAVLDELEFKTISRQLPSILAHFTGETAGLAAAAAEQAAETATALEAQSVSVEVNVVSTEEALQQLVRDLEAQVGFAFDTETDSLNPLYTKLVGLSFSWEGLSGPAYYVPVGHEEGEQLPLEQVLAALKPVLENPKVAKFAHNAKFDVNVLSQFDVCVQGLRFDSMVADYLVDPSRPHGLKELAYELLGVRMTPISELIGTGAKAISMAKVDLRKAADYAGADAAVTSELVTKLSDQLVESGVNDLYTGVELPLIEVLSHMEQHGVKVDTGYLGQLSHVMGNRLQALEGEIHALAGGAFNINSPKQLAVVLFETLGLPVIKKTKTGPSTDASVLEELSEQHEIVAKILEFRQLTKLKGTYVDALPSLINPRDGMLHTSYNQTVAATGRLSSTDPNLQNIPIRTEEGREIRRAFVPSKPGYVLMAADYSQIELRILAQIAKEPAFIQAFKQDEDIHALTASQIFEVPLAEVTKDQRRVGKTINFATIYGQGAFSLARILGIPQKDAKRFIDAFWEHYSAIKHYQIEALAQAKARGYVSTLLGRRRYIRELSSSNPIERKNGERMAINAPIQGTAADIIKIAMVRLHAMLRDEGFAARMLLQVHDELVFEVPEGEVEALSTRVREIMEGAVSLEVPLRVDINVGPSWMEAK